MSERILIAGAGVSGLGALRMLQATDAHVDIADDRPGHGAIPVDQVNLDNYDMVVTSPGWRPDSPLLSESVRRGIPVIGDVELAWRLDRAEVFGRERRWLVVTGTNGKTTTTAMLEKMMQAAGVKARAVGNIGLAVGEALTEERIDVMVAELSSFQLHWSPTLTPDAGVLLNLAEDHIDWHGGFQAYADAKVRALRGPVAIAGTDDPQVRAALSRNGIEATGFGLDSSARYHVAHGQLMEGDTPLASAEGIEPAGPAGVLDALAAAAMARSQGVGAEAIQEALSSFHVAGHRGQLVGEWNGIRAIDNSKATNPHATDAAMKGLGPIIWVAGGQLKGADITELIRSHRDHIKAALILGQDRHIISQVMDLEAPETLVYCTPETDPETAMDDLVKQAKQWARPGDTILLAPAAASLDMYEGMGQRGDIFAAAIKKHFGGEHD